MFNRKKDEADELNPEAEMSDDDATPTPLKSRAPFTADRPQVGRAPVSRPEVTRRAPDIHGTSGSETKRLLVGRDIILHGEITACDKLVVEGCVEASLNDCREIDISPSGTFKGEAEIDVADISGTFDGTLTVRDILIVRSTGRLTGKLTYGQLEIERGGKIVGDIHVLDADKQPPARKVSAAPRAPADAVKTPAE